MYALVRFLDDQDNRRHVISIKDILDFEPKGKSDFDNKAVYTVFWRDDIDVNTGNYSAQILMLGDTEEEVRDRTKRVPVPKVTVEESEEEEPPVQKRKQAAKKKKENQASVKRQNYESILRMQLGEAHRKNSTAGRKRRHSSSTSASDESLVSSGELREAKKEVHFWKTRCKELQQDNQFLKDQVHAQQEMLKSKIFKLEQRQDQLQSMEYETAQFDADYSEEKSWQPAGGKVASSTVQKPARDENAGLLPEQGSTTATLAIFKPSSSTSTAGASAELEVGSAAGEISSKKHAEFTYLLDGSLHLQNGIILSKLQASRIVAHKKPTLVVKETAQAIWGQSGLAIRSVKGGLAPRNRGTAQVAKPRLTPEKVEIVAATLDHWERITKIDASAAKKNLTNILSEKIQDSIKAERRLQIAVNELP